ncbi:phage minor head protein [Ohtaekwangia kribbensis]|uniref:Phage minor head protein n=1 Tax=Ohtaekwangia kribbensis TaxID=688913 RepID=A0ABW3JXQ3_9BACT
MRYNTFVTSVFKQHHFALDMARELFDDNGEIRSFGAFKKAVKDKVDPNYNKNWLRTEYNTAYASGQMARKWQTYVRKGGYIRYVAVMDQRVRYDHANMNGARYPVDHPFWLNHYPPNGWNCRCTTRWDGTEGELIPAKYIDPVPKMFQNNVGITGLVFNDSPYFTVDGAFKEAAEKLFGFKPPVDLDRYEANVQLYSLLSEDKNYKLSFVDNLTGGFIFRHIKTGANDLAQNIAASKALARRGDSVIIREVLTQHGLKNPDIILSGITTEIKTNETSTINAIDSALRRAKRQAEVIVLNINSSMNPERVEQAIYNRVRRTTAIKRVIVVYKDVAYDLTYEEIINQTFYGKIGK